MNYIAKTLKIFAMAVMLSAGLVACQKDPIYSATEQDLSFNVNSVLESGLKSSGGFKSTDADTINCSTLTADYVKYKVDNGNFKPLSVFYVGGVPFTNTIKMSTGQHTLNEFLVYSDSNTPNDTTDDVLLSAVPHTNSVFSGYVTTPLNLAFTVNTDKKTDLKVDVVCFEPKYFSNFGFTYFQLNTLNIREQWFFGDFCIKNAADYTGSQYTQQSNWVASGYIDAPAIFKVEVYRNNILQNTFQNSAQGEKVAVTYGDYTLQTDNFEFKLYVLVRQGNSFVYNYFKSWSFQDNTNIAQGTDGVVDFVLGNCYDPSTPPDLVLAPWMNLPLTATYKIVGNIAPGSMGAYVNAQLTNIPNGYEISNGVYPSNCADHSTNITTNAAYNMDVYSSLYQDKLPLFARSVKWERINWLYNHLDWYPTMHWYDLQGTIWLYDIPVWNGLAFDGVPALTPLSVQMKADADLYGNGYKVPSGGWAAVIFIPTGTPTTATTATTQTMFVKVDP